LGLGLGQESSTLTSGSAGLVGSNRERSLLTPHTLFFLHTYFSNISLQKNSMTFYSNLDL
jgi:hypothetical protein